MNAKAEIKPTSLLSRWLGSDSAAAEYREQMDRRERGQLCLRIAAGAERDFCGERPITQAAQSIDKLSLWKWLRAEMAKIREEAASVQREIIVQAVREILAAELAPALRVLGVYRKGEKAWQGKR